MWAISRPMPLAPPVMAATRSVSNTSGSFLTLKTCSASPYVTKRLLCSILPLRSKKEETLGSS